MISTSTPMQSERLSRRLALTGLGAALLLPAAPARALSASEATQLVDRVVAEINGVINSGGSEARMIPQFEAMLRRYADVTAIARTCLGPEARSISSAELSAFTEAFTGYIARKYGKRFREFIGAQITVTGAEPYRDRFIVKTVFNLRGQAPFDVDFLVAERGGQRLFYEMIIEGVSMLATERSEIGAMLDAARGDVGALTARLRQTG
ncbi:MlaC/ttg2D family ABC transporter substrate-binding protein [Pseudooceanicola sp. 200-1SW]|uniref:MlaC/ttg2D family ABC transporter substrate-binding protein n=1 Tax=Pseudooceanicola sp. 200-1SW TaxID=3425949 RepID=UPI003D7F2BB4